MSIKQKAAMLDGMRFSNISVNAQKAGAAFFAASLSSYCLSLETLSSTFGLATVVAFGTSSVFESRLKRTVRSEYNPSSLAIQQASEDLPMPRVSGVY